MTDRVFVVYQEIISRSAVARSVQSLWWAEGEAVAEARRLAQALVDRCVRRTLARSEFGGNCWNVMEADDRWPTHRPQIIAAFSVSAMDVNGSAVWRLAELAR